HYADLFDASEADSQLAVSVDTFKSGGPLLHPDEFVSAKLTAKVIRQVRDPLSLLTGHTPAWIGRLAASCPQLLSFEARHLLLYVLNFDRDRALARLHEPLLEVSYEGEIGTGLGPTLEFYSLVSREFARPDLGMWRQRQDEQRELLYPRPTPQSSAAVNRRLIRRFHSLGRFMGKALADSRKLDLPLSPAFYYWLLGREAELAAGGYRMLALVDPVLARTWRQLVQVADRRRQILGDQSHTPATRDLALNALTAELGCPVEELGLDFTLPGYPPSSCCPPAPASPWTLSDGVRRQMRAYLSGFESAFPGVRRGLAMFRPDELELVFCGAAVDRDDSAWEVGALAEACRPDHGYTLESRAVRMLFRVMSEFGPPSGAASCSSSPARRGCPLEKIGVVLGSDPQQQQQSESSSSGASADDYLPSASTCLGSTKMLPGLRPAVSRRCRMLHRGGRRSGRRGLPQLRQPAPVSRRGDAAIERCGGRRWKLQAAEDAVAAAGKLVGAVQAHVQLAATTTPPPPPRRHCEKYIFNESCPSPPADQQLLGAGPAGVTVRVRARLDGHGPLAAESSSCGCADGADRMRAFVGRVALGQPLELAPPFLQLRLILLLLGQGVEPPAVRRFRLVDELTCKNDIILWCV
uniref:E3 ubiquitin-protein ligase n=1 Tax=Macrostomum lignano TaxID=282301 RepID=A0A1I8F163_9PLAT